MRAVYSFRFILLALLLIHLGSAELLDFNCVNQKNTNPRIFKRIPWLAFIESPTKNCSGALISKSHVITSASCIFDQRDSKVWLRKSRKDIEKHTVQMAYKHQSYNRNTFENDIAILVLESPSRIRPICIWLNIPMQFRDWKNLKASRWVSAKGKKVSRKNDIFMLSQKKCYDAFGKTVQKSQICAGFKSRKKCAGSGSPLVGEILVSGKTSNLLVGLQSYGALSTCVYSEINSYIDWIVGVVLDVDVIVSNFNNLENL
nr:glucanase inhibitor protein 1 [Drosophila takahashii]